MGDYATRRLQAMDACEKVITGIEDGGITTSSALLLCKKIARLVNDTEGQEWLSYSLIKVLRKKALKEEKVTGSINDVLRAGLTKYL